MLGVNPYITFNGNCREAIEFYRSALGAEVVFVHTVGESPMSEMGPPDNIMHCTIKVEGTVIMMSDGMGPGAPVAGGSISLAIGLNDPPRAQMLFDKLVEGGTVIMPVQKTYWAEAFGMLTDRFGVRWMINCEAPR
jgi:PhnB protein